MAEEKMISLLTEIRACTVCKAHLPLGPHPVLQAAPGARLCIIGQAPGLKVHQTGIPWNDASGMRLRSWLSLPPEDFYDPQKVAIMPMGFCYPGKGKQGDNPPRKECAPLWHAKVRALLPEITLTLLVGAYAQAYYLKDVKKATLTETVKAWEEYLPRGFFPLPHPSPRNDRWLEKNPWFEEEVVPRLQEVITALAAAPHGQKSSAE